MSVLRPFQQAVKAGIYEHWAAGRKRVACVLPTGGGKSVVNGAIIREYQGASCSIAHRGELVGQLALALARENVRHRVIGPSTLVRNCTAIQMAELGRSWVDPGARVAVAGVDTLIKRDVSQDSWFRSVGLWACDEGHHLQTNNKWGRAVEMFPEAYGVAWTATPGRADGGGLGTAALGGSGELDAMVEGPAGRELIDAGYLTDYRVFAPPSDVRYDDVPLSAGGDYNPTKLRAAVHASNRIVGDVVAHYQRIAPGKRGITFAVDVEAAGEIARAFRAAGVPAEVVSAKTDDLNRARILRLFRSGHVLQLVNVDLFGEGFDVPACEVVSMVRKTESFALYAQQFGRALRVMVAPELQAVWGTLTDAERRAHIAASPKPRAIIIDHVGNVVRHGLPDARRAWSLANRERASKGKSDAIPLRVCLECFSAYERYLKCCPYCGFYPEPASRSVPEHVDGDLYELDPATLATMRAEIERVSGAPQIPGPLPPIAAAGLQKNWHARQMAHGHLRNAMALWSGWQRHQGRSDSEAYRIFFHTYGTDVLSAQAAAAKDAEALHARILADLQQHGVTDATQSMGA